MGIQFLPGGIYTIQDLTWDVHPRLSVHHPRTQFFLSELLEVEGHQIIVGTVGRHGFHGSYQIYDTQARPVAIPRLRHASEQDIDWLVNEPGSRRLIIMDDGGSWERVVNMATRNGIIFHNEPNRDAQVRKALRVIQLWNDYKHIGKLPQWYLDAKTEMKAGE